MKKRKGKELERKGKERVRKEYKQGNEKGGDGKNTNEKKMSKI